MRRFLLQLVAGVMGLLVVSSAEAQRQRPPDATGAVAVSVLTDGIVGPNSRATRAINELAERPEGIGRVRVLPIAGRGATENVRDLLQLRGVDLAILNSDILQFLDRTRQHPQARRLVRFVTHLFDQKVYLLVRKDLNAIEDLRGRRLVVLSKGAGSHITATVLFGQLGIDVTLEALGSEVDLDDAGLAKVDGVLLLSDELARVRLSAPARQGLRVLPIGLTPALQGIYKRALIEPQELPGLPDKGSTETVAVSTLLAVYDWNPSQARFAGVSSFMGGLFSALPSLRQRNPGSVWRQADINAQLAGWTRHSAARPDRVLAQAQLAELAVVEQPQVALPPLAQQPSEAMPQTPNIKVLAIGRAPLADEKLPDGGLIPALVGSSLNRAGPGGAAGAKVEMRWTTEPPIRSLLGDASVDISLPWDGADCERPNDLVQASAVLCDNAVYSDPIVQVVVGLFVLSDSTFTFDTDESIFGKAICIPRDQDVSALNGQGREWLSQKRVLLVRQSTLLDCASAVQRREADAFVANDLEGRYVLDRLGLAQQFKMAERPLGTRGVHAIVSREHARASELIDQLNRGLKELKGSDAYAAIVREHLMRLWGAKADAR
jgi:ABC-type amino acid transport substrate-binding protein